MFCLEAPGGRVDARVGVLHPEVVLVRPAVVVKLKLREKVTIWEITLAE
jgi:hypothetical protein